MPLAIENNFVDQIEALRDKIFRVTKRLLISSDEAADATQEVIIKLWQLDQNDRKIENVEAYSMTIAKNYCLDRLKSKQANQLSLVENQVTKRQTGLERTLDYKNQWEWVNKFINDLPEKERMVIQLRDIEQYEFDKIAAILDVPQGTVRVYLTRARKKIRTQFLKIQQHGLG